MWVPACSCPRKHAGFPPLLGNADKPCEAFLQSEKQRLSNSFGRGSSQLNFLSRTRQ